MSSCAAKIRMASATLLDIAQLTDTGLDSVGFQNTGTIRVAASTERSSELDDEVALCSSLGVTVEWPMPSEKVAQLAPFLQLGEEAKAAYVPGDGWVDPTLLAQVSRVG